MRKFNSHSIPIRLNLLFSIVILLFMTIIGRLLYMQVLNKDFYETKLASASKTNGIKIGMIASRVIPIRLYPCLEFPM